MMIGKLTLFKVFLFPELAPCDAVRPHECDVSMYRHQLFKHSPVVYPDQLYRKGGSM